MSGFLTKIAHNNRLSLGPKDTKSLADLISTEKRLMEQTQNLAQTRTKSSLSLKDWGVAEGPDLGDVLTKVALLFDYLSGAEKQFAEHDASFRMRYKDVRTREENLSTLKRSQASLASKIDSQEKKVSKMKEENKDLPVAKQKLREMHQEMVGLEHSVTNEDTELSDFKRMATREALSLKLGALLELGEKTTIIGELGKLLVEEIPLQRTEPGAARAPYQGYEATDQIMSDAQRCIQDVVFNPLPPTSSPGAQQQHYATPSSNDPYHPSPDHGGYGSQSYASQHAYPAYGERDSRVDPLEPLPTIHHSPLRGATEFPSASPNVSAYGSPAMSGYGDANHSGQEYGNRSSLAYMDSEAGHQGSAQERGVRGEETFPVDERDEQDYERGEAHEREQAEADKREYDYDRAQEGTTPEEQTQQYNPRQEHSQHYEQPQRHQQEYEEEPQRQCNEPDHPPPPQDVQQPEERPYVPHADDGAYHGPVSPDDIQPRTPLTPLYTALSTSQQLTQSPTAPQQVFTSPPSQPTTSAPLASPTRTSQPAYPTQPPFPQTTEQAQAASAQPLYLPSAQPSYPTQPSSPSRPLVVRGESALGSKHGDIFVPHTIGSSTSGAAGGSFLGQGTSGYNARTGGDASSIGSREARRVNAGAFRRPAAQTGNSYGILVGGMGESRYPTGPSEANAIREAYRAAEEAPKFDVSPLRVGRGPSPSREDRSGEGVQRSETLPAYVDPHQAPLSPTSTTLGNGFGAERFVTRLD